MPVNFRNCLLTNRAAYRLEEMAEMKLTDAHNTGTSASLMS
ncbi:hypothetical protein [Microcoleus sp. FACHB-672]|nr:hypothetical protein [Microcoleus sp. FACHB-672]